jgi:hypothetical protein
MTVILPAYRDLVKFGSSWAMLPPWRDLAGWQWLGGQVLQESGGIASARHYDASIDPNKYDDGMHEDYASYGLMQIEGFTIKNYLHLSRDTQVDYSFLYYPVQNLSWGLRVLTENLTEYHEDVDRALAAYNGGSRGAEINPDAPQQYPGRSLGMLVDQTYVEAVYAKALTLKE